DGMKLDSITRELFRQGVESDRFADDVFTAPGAERFAEYLAAPVYDGGGARVSRLATALWESRPDLRKAYPDIEGENAAGYLEWIDRFGDETGLATHLLLGRARPNGGRPIADDSAEADDDPAPARPQEVAGPRPGVNVVGYLSSERGVGEAARQVVTALRTSGIRTAEIDAPAEPREIDRKLPGPALAEHPYDFNLLCINADMLPTIAAALGPYFFQDRRSAGLWFWEVSEFPVQWHAAFKNLDEVWVASEFIAEALRPVAPIPVRT